MILAYQNPVWSEYFADPFVLKVGRDYYAYGTGAGARIAAGVFSILRSADLSHWEPAGHAMTVSSALSSCAFWAPEVAAHEGRFFLYYSRGPRERDESHRVHVAIANDPTGPFTEYGEVLSRDSGFSIDAHPFQDPRDGRWYLFYACDYFEGRAGTGLAVVPLKESMTQADGGPRLVVQGNADWQIYERNRPLYGKIWTAWHTVEGPCVVAHDGGYYCFYSGGNWQTEQYGVSYAVADHPLGPWHHAPETGPIVLAQRAPDVLGPGHNSYVVAPDDRTELLVYHAWDARRTARRMCLDPLVWTPAGPRCRGPTTGPQRVGD